MAETVRTVANESQKTSGGEAVPLLDDAAFLVVLQLSLAVDGFYLEIHGDASCMW